MEPIWITVAEARRVTSLGLTKFYALVNDGTIQTVKLGKRRLVKVASLKALGEGRSQ